MTLLAFGSVKGSPGATTTAVAIAGSWPSARPVILVEADPAGGDLAARFGLDAEPGLVSLASATRRAPSGDALLAHAQELPGGLPVLPAPAGSSQACAALTMIVSTVTATWSRLATDVIADCGRLDPDSPSLELIGQADAVVVVVRPQLADLHHLAARAADLRARCRCLAVVLAGAGPYTTEEVADAVGAEVLGAIPSDPAGACLLGGQPGSRRGLSRTAIMRGARHLASNLATIVSEHAADVVAPPSGNGSRPAVEAR